MRSNDNHFLTFLLLPAILLTACKSETREYTEFYPQLMSRESLESSVSFRPPEDIVAPAKIYYKDHYIFISERFKGVHIINNSDPAKPVNTGYISIPGCIDIAIRGDILYADNATDLVAIDLSTAGTKEINVTKRIRDAFPELLPPDGKALPEKYSRENRPANTVLVAWKK